MLNSDLKPFLNDDESYFKFQASKDSLRAIMRPDDIFYPGNLTEMHRFGLLGLPSKVRVLKYGRDALSRKYLEIYHAKELEDALQKQEDGSK